MRNFSRNHKQQGSKIKLYLLVCILTVAMLLTACAAGSMSSSAGAEDYSNEEQYSKSKMGNAALNEVSDSVSESAAAPENVNQNAEENTSGSTDENKTDVTKQSTDKSTKVKEQKLVYTSYIEIETLQFNETVEAIKKLIKSYDGFINSDSMSDNSYNWYQSDYAKSSGTSNETLTIRVPSEKYQAFLAKLESSISDTAKIMQKNSNVSDITLNYYKTSAQLETLLTQQKRLMQMLKDAKTVDDMIKLEARLTEVESQLNQITQSLNSMDLDVNYSTITVSISEVVEYKETTGIEKQNKFIDRLKNTLVDTKNSFISFLEGLLFAMIRLAPFAVFAIILFIITKPLRKRYKDRKPGRKRKTKDEK